MAFEIVECVVVWTVNIGYSGNELAPMFKKHGDFETEGDADRELASLGFTRGRGVNEWHDGMYGRAYIKRVLIEQTVVN